MEAIIYIRWSSLEQSNGDSYNRQINNCTRFAEKHNYTLSTR